MLTSRSLTRSICRFTGMCALALLATGLLAPNSAKAAHCGQYVQSEKRFAVELAALLSGDVENGMAVTPTGTMPLPPVAPCKGAFCSTPPAAPPAAPVAPISMPGQDGLCLMDQAFTPSAHSFLLPAPEDDVHSAFTGMSIFHPPRAR